MVSVVNRLGNIHAGIETLMISTRQGYEGFPRSLQHYLIANTFKVEQPRRDITDAVSNELVAPAPQPRYQLQHQRLQLSSILRRYDNPHLWSTDNKITDGPKVEIFGVDAKWCTKSVVREISHWRVDAGVLLDGVHQPITG